MKRIFQSILFVVILGIFGVAQANTFSEMKDKYSFSEKEKFFIEVLQTSLANWDSVVRDGDDEFKKYFGEEGGKVREKVDNIFQKILKKEKQKEVIMLLLLKVKNSFHYMYCDIFPGDFDEKKEKKDFLFMYLWMSLFHNYYSEFSQLEKKIIVKNISLYELTENEKSKARKSQCIE